jgi:amidohydrolase
VKEEKELSLKPEPIGPVPQETARLAKAVFPAGTKARAGPLWGEAEKQVVSLSCVDMLHAPLSTCPLVSIGSSSNTIAEDHPTMLWLATTRIEGMKRRSQCILLYTYEGLSDSCASHYCVQHCIREQPGGCMSEFDRLQADIDELVPSIVAMRRDLHEHPELAFEEVRTSGIVAQRLRTLGLEVQTGIAKTGIVGLLRGEASQPGAKTIALRADMDALPIQEWNEIAYCSIIDGKMHACGHDGHTSILLAVADMLSKRRRELSGHVKFVFQPAEEIIGGAEPMVNEGAMQGVDGVIGLHLVSDYPVGRVGVRAGPVFASADRFVLTVTGSGGGAARPERSIDPIVIAAYITTALQTLISRETSPFSPAVITIGMIHAGTAFNIIPETARMEGTMRAFSGEHREKLMRRIGEVATGLATAMKATCHVEVFDGCPPCLNDPAMTEVVRQAAVTSVGEQKVDDSEDVMKTAGDDMAYFLKAVPGCYFIVGAHNEEKGAKYPHHHPRFNIDEEALPIGVEVLTRTVMEYLK